MRAKPRAGRRRARAAGTSGFKNPEQSAERSGRVFTHRPGFAGRAAQQSGKADNSLDGLDDWVAALPETKKDDLLLTLIKGEDPNIGPQLLQHYRAERGSRSGANIESRRSAGELLRAVKARRNKKRQAEARRQAKARAEYLADLAKRENNVWRDVGRLIDERQLKAYDQAVDILKELRELYESRQQLDKFQGKVNELCAQHRRKARFIAVVERAKLLQ